MNKITGIYNEGGNPDSRLHYVDCEKYKKQIARKYGNNHDFSKFKWQSSFYDHFIRDRKDLYHHLKYIKNQWIKHDLKENTYCFVDEGMC